MTPPTSWSRRGLLTSAFGLGLGLASGPLLGEPDAGAAAAALPPGFPRQELDAVREVVGRSHFDLERVRELVSARPALARASWDWGFGDWESALGAASHTGRGEIAQVLIEHGARPNLFTAAMLGQLAVVRATIEARPGIQSIRGPHGLTLLHHARQGGEPARAVVAYLEQVGGADPALPTVPLPPEGRALYPGEYRFGPGADEIFEVTLEEETLRLGGPSTAQRTLHPLGDHAFSPAGAEAVRIRFEVADGRARAVTVHDPGLLARGVRGGGAGSAGPASGQRPTP